MSEALLSSTEWRIMMALWDLKLARSGPIAVYIRQALGFDEVPVKRVRILLGRLEGIGYVRSEGAPRFGRGRPGVIYTPVVTREEAVRDQVEEFLKSYRLESSQLAALLVGDS